MIERIDTKEMLLFKHVRRKHQVFKLNLRNGTSMSGSEGRRKKIRKIYDILTSCIVVFERKNK